MVEWVILQSCILQDAKIQQNDEFIDTLIQTFQWILVYITHTSYLIPIAYLDLYIRYILEKIQVK